MSQENTNVVLKAKAKKLEFGKCVIDNEHEDVNYAPVFLPRIGSKFWVFNGAPVCKTVEDISLETKDGYISHVGVKFLGDKKFRTFDSSKMFDNKGALLEAAFPDEETE